MGQPASQPSPTYVLSHPAMASDSSHGMLSPAIWLVCITPILPHARVASLRTDVTAGPGSAWQGLFQDEALGGIPASGVQEHGLTQAVPWEIPNQAVPAAVREQVTPLSRDLWGWNPALHPSTPVPRAA